MPELPGAQSRRIPQDPYDTFQPTGRADSPFYQEGAAPVRMYECTVVNVNYVNWTIDCRSVFDQKFFPDIQVASPYVHPARGEGIYAVPEVGSKCIVGIHSDGPPPFVLGFIMPAQGKTTPDDEKTNPGGTDAYTFAGGRIRAKPGDMILRGRDGNFVVLHRGGVLQIGATSVAQRIYIPLRNLITDISQNYEHHNTGGSINWGIASSALDDNPETEWRQTFRVFANDESADVRIAMGKVRQPVPDPADDDKLNSMKNALEVGTTDPVVMEVAVAPQGFDAAEGQPNASARSATKLRLYFDRGGNGFLRMEGSLGLRIKKRLWIDADDDIDLGTRKFFRVVADKKIQLSAEKGVDITSSNGAIVLNAGSAPIATKGSIVEITVVGAPVIGTAQVGGSPVPFTGTIVTGTVLQGVVVTGSPTVFAPSGTGA